MKQTYRRILFLILFFIPLSVFALDIKCKNQNKCEYHDHYYYQLCFNTETLCPDYVIWTLNVDEAIEAEQNDNRTNDFRKCGSSAKPSDYSKTGFDRGHMCPNNDMDFSEQAASSTFRMCNMCPQVPSFNRGIWKELEKKDHDYAKKYGTVTIVCGPIFNEGANLYIGKVKVPNGFFRIYYNEENNFLECYALSQSDTELRIVSLDVIERLTNLKLN